MSWGHYSAYTLAITRNLSSEDLSSYSMGIHCVCPYLTSPHLSSIYLFFEGSKILWLPDSPSQGNLEEGEPSSDQVVHLAESRKWITHFWSIGQYYSAVPDRLVERFACPPGRQVCWTWWTLGKWWLPSYGLVFQDNYSQTCLLLRLRRRKEGQREKWEWGSKNRWLPGPVRLLNKNQEKWRVKAIISII